MWNRIYHYTFVCVHLFILFLIPDGKDFLHTQNLLKKKTLTQFTVVQWVSVTFFYILEIEAPMCIFFGWGLSIDWLYT
jgi:hypothetical protein